MTRAAARQVIAPVSALPPTWLIAGALAPEGWLSPAQHSQAAALPAWVETVSRARLLREHLGDDPVPIEAGHEHWLRDRAQLAPEETAGACSAWSDGLGEAVCEGAWRVDPVHLHLGRDHVVLTRPEGLALDLESAASLARAIETLLAEEGLKLHVPVASRWYLTALDAAPAPPLRLLPRTLGAAIGRNIEAYLPVGPDVRRWRKILNEIQMTWFTHPVNETREAQGLPVVNGLWLEGRCPARNRMLATRPASLHRDDSLLQAQFEGDPAVWCARWQELWSRLATLERPQTPNGPDQTAIRIVLCGDRGWREIEVGGRKVGTARGGSPWRAVLGRLSQGALKTMDGIRGIGRDRENQDAAPSRTASKASRWLDPINPA